MLRERDVALRSLTEGIDTNTAAGRMLYSVLGALAQFERDILRERTVAGMRAAKKRGQHVGRKPALSAIQKKEAQAMIERGDRPAHVAKVLRVGLSTLYRHLG
jgi:DNA invertase Pin-like site-specific DNA recombinase